MTFFGWLIISKWHLVKAAKGKHTVTMRVRMKLLMLTIMGMCVVPEGALQDWHAASLQDVQLQESHLLRPLRQLAVGPVQTRPQVWRCAHTFFLFLVAWSRSFVCQCHSFFFPPRRTLQTDCGMNVHSNCQKKVANLCGINQKLLAEALSQVSQVCTLILCSCKGVQPGAGGRKDLSSLFLSLFPFFRNQSRSPKNQMPQTLESIKMSRRQQQTLVVRLVQRKTRSWTISASQNTP